MALNLQMNLKSSIRNSSGYRLNSNIENLLELKTVDDSENESKLNNGDSQLNDGNEGSESLEENLLTDLAPEERGQSESSTDNASQTSSKDPLEKRNTSNFNRSTQSTDTGKGSIMKLAEHHIQCGEGEALSGYHLWGESRMLGSNKIGMEFNCVKLPPSIIAKKHVKRTELIEIKGKIYDALLIISKKALNIECPEGQVISGISYIGQGLKLGLQTNCIEAKVKDCVSEFTKEHDVKTMFFSDRCINQYSQFYVLAKEKKVLQKVIHFKKNENTMKIHITSCSLDSDGSTAVNPKSNLEKDIKKKSEEEEKKKKLLTEEHKLNQEKKEIIEVFFIFLKIN